MNLFMYLSKISLGHYYQNNVIKNGGSLEKRYEGENDRIGVVA